MSASELEKVGRFPVVALEKNCRTSVRQFKVFNSLVYLAVTLSTIPVNPGIIVNEPSMWNSSFLAVLTSYTYLLAVDSQYDTGSIVKLTVAVINFLIFELSVTTRRKEYFVSWFKVCTVAAITVLHVTFL